MQTLSGDLEIQVEKHTEAFRASLNETSLKIADRKKAENTVKAEIADMEVMMGEIYTRVRKNIGLILALLELKNTGWDSGKLQISTKTLYQRINTILLVHKQILTHDSYGLVDFKGFLQALLDCYSDSAFAFKEIKLELEATSRLIWVDQAIPLAMAANELINNAFSHAFSKNTERDALLKVLFSNADPDVCTLEVQDNGSGFVFNDQSAGKEYAGLQLAKMLVEDQLNGSLEIDNHSGVRAVISFSMDQHRQGHIRLI